MKLRSLASRIAAAALAALVGLAPAPALAFDTGHHADLTDAVLRAQGFPKAAIRQVQVANWIADYLNTPVSPDRTLVRYFENLHFDDLETEVAVRQRWRDLVRNTHDVATDAARRGDIEDFLTVLGLSLHAVQDFYSHSNWVDAHPRSVGMPFRTETYFSDPAPGIPLRTTLDPAHSHSRALVHGDYFHGMNRDSYVRAGWADAYVFAHTASREWVATVHAWAETARPGFWREVVHWKPGREAVKDLQRQLLAAERLSSFGSAGFASSLALVRRLIPTGVDGHWKGNGSGSFLGTLMASLGGVNPRESAVTLRAIALTPALVAHMGRVPKLALRPSLGFASASIPIAQAPPVRVLPMSGQALMIRTLTVSAHKRNFDLLSPPDFYSAVWVAGHRFLEAPQLDRAAIHPAWTTLSVLPLNAGRMPVRYELWDQDFPNRDDAVALTQAGPLQFWFDADSGEVGGLPPEATVLTQKADGTVRLMVEGREAHLSLALSVIPVAGATLAETRIAAP